MDQTKTDTIYDTFDRTLYKTGANGDDPVMDSLMPDPNANQSDAVNVPPDSLGSGNTTATVNQSAGTLASGQQVYNDSTNGYFIGTVNGVAKISIGPSTGNHITWDGNTLTVVGGISTSSLDIPDATTANSFHVDVSGNSWWGANVATGYTGANAYILNTGQAVFKNVAIGGTTIQYVITNSGIFSFGDGADGDVVISADTTLVTDKYYNNLTVDAGKTLNPGGYRIFVKNTLTLNGTIARNGSGGSNGGNGGLSFVSGYGANGGGGTALADGYLKGAVAGGNGSHGGSGDHSRTPGSPGSSTTNSLGTDGISGGVGGVGADPTNPSDGGAGGAGGTATVANVRLTVGVQLAQLLDVSSSGSTVKYGNSGAGGGGGGGGDSVYGGGNSPCGGNGGGGATAGAVIAIYARIMVIGATGLISSNGGVGGNGGAGNFNGIDGTGNYGAGGGGGGAGGNGGLIILTYNQFTNAGSITVTAGAGGLGGAAGTGAVQNGNAGAHGNAGSDGTIYQFQLSL